MPDAVASRRTQDKCWCPNILRPCKNAPLHSRGTVSVPEFFFDLRWRFWLVPRFPWTLTWGASDRSTSSYKVKLNGWIVFFRPALTFLMIFKENRRSSPVSYNFIIDAHTTYPLRLWISSIFTVSAGCPGCHFSRCRNVARLYALLPLSNYKFSGATNKNGCISLMQGG